MIKTLVVQSNYFDTITLLLNYSNYTIRSGSPTHRKTTSKGWGMYYLSEPYLFPKDKNVASRDTPTLEKRRIHKHEKDVRNVGS